MRLRYTKGSEDPHVALMLIFLLVVSVLIMAVSGCAKQPSASAATLYHYEYCFSGGSYIVVGTWEDTAFKPTGITPKLVPSTGGIEQCEEKQ